MRLDICKIKCLIAYRDLPLLFLENATVIERLRTYQHHKADRFSRERRQEVHRKITFIAEKKAVVRERTKKRQSRPICNTPEAQAGVAHCYACTSKLRNYTK